MVSGIEDGHSSNFLILSDVKFFRMDGPSPSNNKVDAIGQNSRTTTTQFKFLGKLLLNPQYPNSISACPSCMPSPIRHTRPSPTLPRNAQYHMRHGAASLNTSVAGLGLSGQKKSRTTPLATTPIATAFKICTSHSKMGS